MWNEAAEAIVRYLVELPLYEFMHAYIGLSIAFLF